MRILGEQWIEDGRMFKAVEGQGCENCWGCHWSDANSGCDSMVVCPVNASETGLIVKDLGALNEDGCLAEERTGLFPVVENHFHNLWIVTLITNDFPKIIQVSCYGATKQQAIDAWNRRV